MMMSHSGCGHSKVTLPKLLKCLEGTHLPERLWEVFFFFYLPAYRIVLPALISSSQERTSDSRRFSWIVSKSAQTFYINAVIYVKSGIPTEKIYFDLTDMISNLLLFYYLHV